MLIEKPGSIAQLNMGLGKTRVILPMLILHWISEKSKMIRLHFLTPLLQEALAFLQKNLTASSLGIKFFCVPFNRDVQITTTQIKTIVGVLETAQKYSGVIVVAPEHRLSMYLKSIELHAKNLEISQKLAKIEKFSYVDILDEVDDILRTKYQLVYAIGDAELLDAGIKRW
jgi:hypothetical protein